MGCPTGGLPKGAAAHSFREVHPTAGWRQGHCGSWPRASAVVWAGHVRNAWLGGHLLRRERQGGVAELTQNVITAAQDFALHRQGRVLATVRAGSQLVVVGVIGGTTPSGALGRLEGGPAQLRGALPGGPHHISSFSRGMSSPVVTAQARIQRWNDYPKGGM